ncbi:hypothetical protein GE09DRAFT_1292234 [Coniochaeta sp. 2T2.1]|nr:hypothetical protein GE09DRAFT_1292234 [Coniochaeta sp. 2T2.1]
MSKPYPRPRNPQVPLPSPNPPPSSPDFPYPGLRRTGDANTPRGRGLVATATFPAGSAIAAFPRPLLCLPDGEHVRTACDWCLRPGAGSSGTDDGGGADLGEVRPRPKLNACTGCRCVVYCSKTCQSAAWKAVHKLECPALRGVKDGVFGATRINGKETEAKGEGKWFVPTAVRCAMQLLLRLKTGDRDVRDAVGDIPFVGTTSGAKGVLEGNVHGFRDYEDGTMWKDLGAQARAALQSSGIELEGDKLAAAAEGVRGLLCRLQTNAFDRRDEDVGAAGVLLDVDLAMANHSCLPNAYVVFAGRTAILRAERDIGVGEEVEISYIDNNLSKAERQKALGLYHFGCQCRRCQEDLDVYQVCQSSSTIPLNILSLQPDLDLYKNPPIERNHYVYDAPRPPIDSPNYDLYHMTVGLKDKKMYAIEPFPSLYHQLVVRYETEELNLAYALAIACFLATQCHPYGHVVPFKPWRVKGLMMIAQLLSHTAPLSATGELGKKCGTTKTSRVLVDELAKMDQVSMCEAILRLVVHYGPMAHSDDWEVLRSARELLEDIAQLQGRERESAAIAAWVRDPEQSDARAFVDEMVLKPINVLASRSMGWVFYEALCGPNSVVPDAPGSSVRRLVCQP